MELDIRKLAATGKFSGSFNFKYQPPDDICLIPLCKIGDVKVSGEYEIFDDDSVEVRFTVDYTVKGQCSYCLSDTEKEVNFLSEVLFVTEKDDENYYYDGIRLNLKTAVNDAILISQPHVLLCKEDCKGIDVT